MVSIADVDECMAREFGSRLEPHGFRLVGKRKWARSSGGPVRHLMTIGAVKGATYVPIWGISSGIVPTIRAKRFGHQTTDKNAVMDLIVDPIDLSGRVPNESFAFLPGATTSIPALEIRRCAEHFVPVALGHFARAQSLDQFCELFRVRSRLHYARFAFDMYTRHRIARGFVSLLEGNEAEGLALIRTFCEQEGLDQTDRVLQESVAAARGRLPFDS
jgi:hypothetical protein